MNITGLMSLKKYVQKFRNNHPQLEADANMVMAQGFYAGQEIEITVRYPDGKELSSKITLDTGDIDTIESVRKNSIDAFKLWYEFNQEQKTLESDEETEKQGYKFIEYSKKNDKTSVDTLKCKHNQTGEAVEKYYTKNTEVKSKSCEITCKEKLEVYYDPPQAMKGGMCISYKVTVRSKVDCAVTKSPKINWPKPASGCGLTPICENNDSEVSAGPNEEFDSCVNTCDGGKYTQACINSCYNKVYKNKNAKTKKTNVNTSTDFDKSNIVNESTNKSSVVQIANSQNDPYYSNKECKGNFYPTEAQIENCVDYFMDLKQKYPMGYYEKYNDSKHTWIQYMWKPCFDNKKDICKDITFTVDPSVGDKAKNEDTPRTDKQTMNQIVESVKRASPYYFRDPMITEKTLKSFIGKGNGVNKATGTLRKYEIDNKGIKRQSSTKYYCHETCGYQLDDGDNPNAKTNACKMSDKAVKKYYDDEFEKIINALNGCNAKAQCKEDTSTFTIDVDNNTTSEDKKTEWKANNKTNDNEVTCNAPTATIPTDTRMFIPLLPSYNSIAGVDKEETDANALCANNGINGKCYGKSHPTYWQDYKTTVTFPGTWTDHKHGTPYYNTNGLNLNTVTDRGNLFCIPKTAKNVNREWWNWKVNGLRCTTSGAEKTEDVSDIKVEKDDNIRVTIDKFGKYNWHINVNCFYAVNKTTGLVEDGSINTICNPPKEKDEPDCESGSSTEFCNVQFRPVTQEKLFPDSTGNSSRDAGFNWTSAAQDKSITNDVSGYGINPGEYAKKLEDAAKVDPDTDYKGEADYSLHLTKANIQELRKFAKANGYTSFGEIKGEPVPNNLYKEVKDVEGLEYYTSSLLHYSGTKYVTDLQYKNILGKNND